MFLNIFLITTVDFILVCFLCLLPGVCVKEAPRWRIPQEDGRIVRVCFVHRQLIQGQTAAAHSVYFMAGIGLILAGRQDTSWPEVSSDTCCFKTLCLLEAALCHIPHTRSRINIYLWYLSDILTSNICSKLCQPQS